MIVFIKNALNPNMSSSVDVDFTDTPKDIVYQIERDHSVAKKILGNVNTQLLEDEVIFVDSAELVLENEGDNLIIDKDTTIIDFILKNNTIFNSVETPVFLINIKYGIGETDPLYYSYYEDCIKLLTKYCETLVVYNRKYSYSPIKDNIGTTGADITVTIKDDIPITYSVNLDCAACGGEQIRRHYEYKSKLITDKVVIKKLKNAIIYNKFSFSSDGITVYLEACPDDSAVRIVLSQYVDLWGDPEYDIEIDMFENDLLSLIWELPKEMR